MPAQLFQHALGIFRLALPGHLLHAVDHGLQVLRRDRPHVPVVLGVLLRIVALLAHHLFRELAEILVHRPPQFLRQARDLIVAGIAVERVAQGVLRLLQRLLRVGHVAFLDLDRHVPEIFGERDQVLVGPRRAQPRHRGAQPEIHTGIGRELVRRDHHRVERGEDAATAGGVEDQVAALLDQRLGHRLGERALRQRDVEADAFAFLAQFVARHQRHLDASTGPGMHREIGRRASFAVAIVTAGQDQRNRRRRDEGRAARLDRLAVSDGLAKPRFGRDHAVIVLHLVGERQRSPRIGLGFAQRLDGGRAVCDRCDGHRAQKLGAAPHGRRRRRP